MRKNDYTANDLTIYQVLCIQVPASLNSPPTPASTIAFDTQQELLWVGNELVNRSLSIPDTEN